MNACNYNGSHVVHKLVARLTVCLLATSCEQLQGCQTPFPQSSPKPGTVLIILAIIGVEDVLLLIKAIDQRKTSSSSMDFSKPVTHVWKQQQSKLAGRPKTNGDISLHE